MPNMRQRMPTIMCVLFSLFMISCATTPLVGIAKTGPANLEYKYSDNPEETFGWSGSCYIEPMNHPPKKLVGQPVLFSKRPLYGEAKLGTDKKASFIMVADESRGTGAGYDTFYIDANLNLDLRDDPKLMAKPGDPNPYVNFPAVELTVPCGEDKLPYHVQAKVLARPEYQRIVLASAAYCEGTLTIDGKPSRIVLLDTDMDGRFDGICKERGRSGDGAIYYGGDVLLMDQDGDGALRNDYNESREVYRLGKFLAFGKQLYTIEIDPGGRRLSIEKAETDTGLIVCKADGGSADLVDKAGAIKLNAPVIRVPVGEYRLAECSFESITDDGVKWRICGRGTAKQKPLTVAKGKKAILEAGPPLQTSISCQKQGDQREFGLRIEGCGKEVYSAGSFLKNGESTPEPRIKIVDNKGNTVAEGKFEYG